MDTDHQFDIGVFASCGKNVSDITYKTSQKKKHSLTRDWSSLNFKDECQHTLMPYKGVNKAYTRCLSSMKTWLKINKRRQQKAYMNAGNVG